jgi:hypothetical protein
VSTTDGALKQLDRAVRAQERETGQNRFPKSTPPRHLGFRVTLALPAGRGGLSLVRSQPAGPRVAEPADRREARMNDNFDKAAIAVIIVFGALILGGLMAANISWGHRNGFLWALGGATAAWIAGHIILFDLPRIYAVLIGVAALMAVASTVSLFN